MKSPVGTTIDERLATTTSAGGFTVLPPNFGDPDGDWMTVRSTDDPFAVLYFDYRQAHRITPELVQQHRDLLTRFWQEKIRSMSQGAAKFSILKKYGGADQNERQVRGYPADIESAYEQLATRGGIEAVYERIRAAKEAGIFAGIDEKLKDFLVDGVLQPEEARALFTFGEELGVSRDVVAGRVSSGLKERGLVAMTPPAGATRADELLSTTWARPEQIPAPIVDAATVRPPQNFITPIFIFAAIVVLILVISAAMIASRRSEVPPAPASVAASTTANPVNLQPPVSASAAPPPVTHTQASILPTEKPRATDTPAIKEAERLAVTDDDRRRTQQELDSIRQLADQDPDAAMRRMTALQVTLSAHPREYADERVSLANLQTAVQKIALQREVEKEKDRLKAEDADRKVADRQRDLEAKLAQIENFMLQKNYTGAKNLAEDLLRQPDLPPPVSERAKRYIDDAIAALRTDWGKAKVTSKTGRPPH